MKHKLILMSIFLCLAMSTYGQQAEENSVGRVITQCRMIVEYDQKINALYRSIDLARHKLDSLKTTWYQICMDYMNSSGPKSAEDFNYLIERTDSVFDGSDLYNLLVEASLNADDDGKEERRQTPPEQPRKKKTGSELDDVKQIINEKEKFPMNKERKGL